QRERALERTMMPLHAMHRPVTRIEAALTPDRQRVTEQIHLDVLLMHARQIETHDEAVLRLLDVRRGCERTQPLRRLRTLEQGIEQSVDIVADAEQLAGGM